MCQVVGGGEFPQRPTRGGEERCAKQVAGPDMLAILERPDLPQFETARPSR